MTAIGPTAVQPGVLYGVGVGPGDPDLITLKGWRLITQTRVIAFPAGINDKPGVAEQIVSQRLLPTHVTLPLTFPYVQDDAALLAAWQQAATTVWHYLKEGEDVVFLSEGDISFYSTFTYLAQALQQLHPTVTIEAIPGVCSPMAAAASLGIPLTIRNQRLTVLPALYSVADLETAIAQADVVVLMKVKSVYEQVWQILQQHSLLDRSYVVEWATHPHQRIYRDLGDRPQLSLSYFSLMIVQVSEH